MIVFIGILLIVWPVIAFAAFVGIAINKKWWSYDTLSLICGGIGILIGFYYSILFGGGINAWVDGWPIWVICIIICGLGSWYAMHNTFERIQQREKEKKDQ